MNDTDSTQYTVDTVKTKTAVSTVEMNQATAPSTERQPMQSNNECLYLSVLYLSWRGGE
jgi:hypothetical protein